MNVPLFLFCGGLPIDDEGRPKPLMKVRDRQSLLRCFLLHLKHRRLTMPPSVTLLCDDGQDVAIKVDLSDFSYPVPINVLACGARPNTFEKFRRALNDCVDPQSYVQFGYPDIFSFDEFSDPHLAASDSDSTVYISAAVLTSRFPRLNVDVYNSRVMGISDYSSPVPANPMYVFGGDLWARVGQLLMLIDEFRTEVAVPDPSLEYDFFFWLINHKMVRCVIQHGERLWIDSFRDVNKLAVKMGNAQCDFIACRGEWFS